MTDTFVAYQVSPRETIRYEIPMALQWVFDEMKGYPHYLTVNTPRGSRRKPPTIQRVLDSLRPWCDELVDQVKVTKTSTPLWPRGHTATITTYDYSI